MQALTLTFTSEFWTRESVSNDPGRTYLFGDNMVGEGMAGQACIRGLDNAIGVPTIDYRPGRSTYFGDADFTEIISVIIERLDQAVSLGKPIVCHVNIGRGIAQLHRTAPRIYAELLVRLHDMAAGDL